jgi:hypothetical protein
VADTKEIKPPVPPKALPLETLGDVRRAMSKVCNEMRTGEIELRLGNALMFGLGQLAHILQDARDNRYKQRVRTLWQAYEKAQKQPGAEAH